ncbi:MAG: DnaJ domain-containing protein [Cyclobacteriaceae bacterium]
MSEDADDATIKAAFKKKALDLHPDRHQGDPTKEELFKEINTAYQTLSNPYSKHKYDMTLRYGSFEIPEQPPPPPKYHYSRRRRRPVFTRPKINSKENLMATMYAFLFAFVIGLCIKIGGWTMDYYENEEKKKVLSERREVFSEVQSAFSRGELEESLQKIDGLGMFFHSEIDMSEYKEMIVADILEKADRSIRTHEYRLALDYYAILKDFPEGNSLNIQLNKAEAYKQLNRPEDAIRIYQQLYFKGYRALSFFIEMGDLHETGTKDYESALRYYKQASKMAAQEYETVFGKAYPVMITADLIPDHHYLLFMKLANAYYLNELYDESIESTKWTKEIWPDSVDHYLISSKCHLALNDVRNACLDFRKARRLDPSISSPSPCL